MKTANPYLNFDGSTEEAFTFYRSVFGGDFLAVVRFEDLEGMEAMDQLSEVDRGKIAHISLPLGGNMLMGTDALESMGQSLKRGNDFYITLVPDTAEEAAELFDALSIGGRVEMPLQETGWAEKYGMCADKFGVQWMVNYGGSKE